MSTLLQITIGFAISIIYFLFLRHRILSNEEDKTSKYVLTAFYYVLPFALLAVFIGKIGFSFSNDNILKNIFIIITIQNVIISLLQAMWLENTLDFAKSIIIRKCFLFAIAVMLSCLTGMADNYYINVEKNSVIESVQEINDMDESNIKTLN